MNQEEMNAQNTDNGGVLAVCPKKKKDKNPVVFYKDRMTFKGETIMYSDVDVLTMSSDHTVYNVLFEYYSASVKFRLKDGRKLKWSLNGFGAFGLGGIKTKIEHYGLMVEACVATIARVLSASYINQVKLGGTITIANITISPTEVSGKHGIGRKMNAVPLTEISKADLYNGSLYIYGADGKAVFNAVQLSYDNAICLLFVINSLVGAAKAQNNQDAPASDAE